MLDAVHSFEKLSALEAALLEAACNPLALARESGEVFAANAAFWAAVGGGEGSKDFRLKGETIVSGKGAAIAANVRRLDNGCHLVALAEPAAPLGELERDQILHHITEGVDDLIAILDTDGRRVFNSESYRRVLGDTSIHEGQDSFSAIVAEDRERIRGMFRRVVDTGLGARAQYRYLLPGGEVRHIESSSNVILDEAGRTSRVIVVARDITERHLAAERTRETLSLLQAIMRVATGAILYVRDRKVQWMNDGWSNMIGYSREEIIGRSMAMAFPDLESFEKSRGEIYHPDGAARIEPHVVHYRRKDGEVFPALVTGAPIDPGNPGMGNVFSLTDISSLSRAEEEIHRLNADLARRVEERTAELRCAHEQLRSIIDTAHDAFVGIDAESRIRDWNKAAEAIFGYRREEVLGRLLTDTIVPHQHRQAHYQGMAHFQAHGTGGILNQTVEITGLRAGGAEFPIELSIWPVPSGDGYRFYAFIRDISERKRFEEALRQRAEQLRQHRNVLLELAQIDTPDFARAASEILAASARTLGLAQAGFWRFSGDGQALACEVSHRGGGGDFEACSVVLARSAHREYFELLAGSEPLVVDEVAKDPRTRSVRSVFSAISSLLDVPVWHQGRMVGVLCHGHDGPPRHWSAEEVDFASSLATLVSLCLESAQRQELLDALRQSEEKYRLVVENANEGILVVQDGVFHFVNRRCADLTGFSVADLMGKPFVEVVHPSDREKVVGNHRLRLQGEDAENHYPFRIVRADGAVRWLSISAVLIQWEGRPASLNFVSDITQRIEAENALRLSQSRFRAIFNTAAVGIGVIEPNAIISEVNANWSKLLGYQPEEARGRSILEITHPDDLILTRRNLDALVAGEVEGYRIEKRYLRQDGSVIWVDVGVTPITGIDGATYAVVATFIDITERRQAEEDIRRALQKERELGELKSRFISMTSHEFRTPLATILSSAELLEHYSERLKVDERLELLHSITLAVSRMNGMLDDVLTIGRADAGRLGFHPKTLDLDGFCSGLADEFRLQLGPGQSLAYKGDPACREGNMDERLLRYMLGNLLSNAIKYSPNGGAIELCLACLDGRAAIVVSDQGIGIPSEDLERLFESFHRAGNVGQISGTGLGLCIVHQSVALHGGEIRVESEVGVGSRFTIVLPTGV